MDIKLTDQIPVAKSYNAVPRALYDEVKKSHSGLVTKGFYLQINLTICLSNSVCEEAEWRPETVCRL